jgi:hypothetical protein
VGVRIDDQDAVVGAAPRDDLIDRLGRFRDHPDAVYKELPAQRAEVFSDTGSVIVITSDAEQS